MGKRIEAQRRGRGGPTFRATRRRRKAAYPALADASSMATLRGQVLALCKDRGRSTVLASVLFEDGSRAWVPACEGLAVGQAVQAGPEATVAAGNILPLGRVPEGTAVFNLEKVPGDGGRLVRASGVYATVVAQEAAHTRVKLSSGKEVRLPRACRATVGCASGGERRVKPLVKAGARYHLMKSKSRLWPRTRGVAKNAVSHPHGGEQHHVGRSKSVPRGAPPGRKVGAVGARRTGRKKK